MFESWFLWAVVSAVLSGLGNFYNKVAVQRKYDKDLFILYGVFVSIAILLGVSLMYSDFSAISWWLVVVAVSSGVLANFTILGKMKTMEYIDVTIFMPLFKTLSPAITILFGMLFFGERFTTYEVVGLILSLTIPLLLISKFEHHRQNNLVLGIVFMLITSAFAAAVVLMHKYSTTLVNDVVTITILVNSGIVLGCLTNFLYKNRKTDLRKLVRSNTTSMLLFESVLRGIMMLGSFLALLYALTLGGELGIVYTITSLYILIPIVLSIYFYGEHWNARKVVAIILSIVALSFFG